MGKKSRNVVQMTEGSLWKNILFFSVPLMLSQILEVLFNLSDIAVVGKFSGYTALGAVGSTSLLVTLYTGFLIGMGSGVTVRTAHSLGSHDEEKTKKTVYSAFIICVLVGAVVMLFSLIMSGHLLELLKTKDELIGQAKLYLMIYSCGMPALAIYNYGNGVLSAVGDTKRPLIYLTIAGILNVILNLFFVIVCGKAADGVAIASVISQYVSALLILNNLFRREDYCKLHMDKANFDQDACKEVMLIGLPAGVQNAIFGIANLFVQTGVNSFDAILVSGNSAAANADNIIYTGMAAFHTACSSFMSQNYGAKKKDRVIKSYFVSLTYSFMTGALLGGALLIFGRQFLSVFSSEEAVITAGMERLKIMGWSYCISAFMDCTIAASRGIGKSIPPMVIVIMGSCVFRIIWIYTVFAYFHTITSLYLLYSFSWSITATAEIIYFIYAYRKTVKIL